MQQQLNHSGYQNYEDYRLAAIAQHFSDHHNHHNQHHHHHHHHLNRSSEAALIHGAPEVAANAMVGAVRIMLVAFICVLLVKLKAPNKKRGGDENDDTTSDSNYKSTTTPTTTSNILQNDENSTTFLRRNSQPEIMTSSKAQQLRERQRRHSEVALSQLRVPPGPMGLPFLGYLPFVGKEIHLTLTSLSERFGPIYQIFLGNIRVVVLNDATLVRQAFKQPVFSGRPDTQLTRILQGYGIVNSEGALWKEQRAFLHSALRKLGAKSLMSGSNGLEAKIQNQVKEFVNDLSVHADEGKPCQVRPIVARAVSSVVGSIVMNLTYRKYEEKEKFDRLIELMQEGFRLFTVAMPLDFIPIFRFLPGVRYAYRKIKENRAETSAFFQGVADEHRRYLSETFNLDSPDAATSLHPTRHTTATTLAAANTTDTATNSSTTTTTTTTTTSFSSSSSSMLATEQQVSSTTATAATSAGGAAAPSSISRSSKHVVDVVSPLSTGDAATALVEVAVAAEAEAVDAEVEATLAPSPVFLNLDGTGNGKQEKQDDCSSNNNSTNNESNAATGGQQQQQQQPRLKVELEDIVVRDLVDAYIVQQKKHETDGKENYFSNQQLVQMMSDIFSAGLETVTSTIEWSILFLILNPECQLHIQDEIDRIIGRQRLPQLEDLAHMPYTEATIYEVIRRSNVVALGNAHATLADASIGGYLIPKGTQVLTNLYGMNMNPKLWNNPDKFDPTRFIVNEKATKPDYFIPFSVGRRMCLGDLLAKMEVFLFLVGLLQKYDLCVADEDRNNPPQVKGTIGISHTPSAFNVALKSRQQMTSAAAEVEAEKEDDEQKRN